MVESCSKSVTSWPRSAHVTAHERPAGPAPTTAILRLEAAATGTILRSSSWPATGLRRQLAFMAWNVWSRHAWLHAMHTLMSSRFPAMAWMGGAGSG